jgi:hypothetical protein
MTLLLRIRDEVARSEMEQFFHAHGGEKGEQQPSINEDGVS